METVYEGPLLVPTEKGSSVLYKDKLLYSKYNPSKTLCEHIKALSILPNTLVLCASPVLDYGIQALLDKLPSNSFILCIQPDLLLFDFAKSHSPIFSAKVPHFLFEHISELSIATDTFLKLDAQYNFFRLLVVHGTSLSTSEKEQGCFFNALITNIEKTLKQKQINRLTLISLGQAYSLNTFKNLTFLSKTDTPFYTTENIRINKPIIILGGGPSLTTNVIKSIAKIKKNCFVLALDAVASKVSASIELDGIVVLESQPFISPAFVSIQKHNKSKKTLLFADLTTMPSLLRLTTFPLVISCTVYAKTAYLMRLLKTGLFSKPFDSFGSVGLAALNIALCIRSSEEIPIFTSGLDFSYTMPFTHSHYAFQMQKIFSQHTKLNPVFKGDVFFSDSVVKFHKSQELVFSTPNLISYADVFNNTFKKMPNVYSVDTFARDNSISLEKMTSLVLQYDELDNISYIRQAKVDTIRLFLQEIQQELITIKNALTNNITLDNNTLILLLQKNDFLYIHFPDYNASHTFNILEKSFLQRIRIEVEYFLKHITGY